jgi:alkylhydroperoxidase/carboxymuconolactone decarboxylase family protein YurZ
MGYLPDVYKDFIKQYPDINKSYDSLANACHKADPDKKTRRLVKLGIAMVLIQEESDLTPPSLRRGLSPDEVRHVVLMAFTTAGFPNMIAPIDG